MGDQTQTPKNVAIFVQKPTHIYSNGCYQQAYYLGKALENAGNRVTYVTADSTYTEFEPYGKPIKVMVLTDDLSWMDCIIFASAILAERAFLSLLSIHDVKIIGFICGNLFTLHQEEFVFGVHNIFKDYLVDAMHEIWMMPMYEYAKDYIEVVTGKTVYICPYVWDTDLIDHAVREAKVPLRYQPAGPTAELDVTIFEPNLSVHKSSLVPFVCLNDLERQDSSLFQSIHAFCMLGEEGNADMERRTTHRKEMLSHLKIQGKTNLYRRLTMPSILEWFRVNKSNSNMVALTHNYMNNLNFVHLELMYLGYPVIHNCPKFQNGLYYEDWHFHDCKELVRKAKNISTWYGEYLNKCKEIVDSFLPTNPDITQAYRVLVERVCGGPKTVSVHEKKRDLLHRLSKEIREREVQNKVGGPCSKPAGIVICSSNELRTQDLIKNIRGLSQRLPIEVYIPHSTPLYSFQDPNIVVKTGKFEEHWRNMPQAALECDFENIVLMDDLTRFLNNPELYFQFEQLKTHGNIVWPGAFGYKETEESSPVSNGKEYAARWFMSIYYGSMFRSGDREVSSSLFVFNGGSCQRLFRMWQILVNNGDYFSTVGFNQGRELVKLAYVLSGTVMFLNNIIPLAISSFGSNDTANILLHQIVDKVGGHYVILPIQVPKTDQPVWNLLETDSSTRWQERDDGLLTLSKVKSVSRMTVQ